MRYDAEQVDNLAAEYVLGTLHGTARRRFDRLMTDRADVRFAVWRWERHLNGFVDGLKPQEPRPQVWKNIRRRIGLRQAPKTASTRRWRGLWVALPTAIAAAWLAIALLPVPTAERMAVFADQNAEALWVISTDLDQALLQIQAINVPPLADDSDYELWILRDNQPPLSLGLLSEVPSSIETRISAELVAALTTSGRLAISQEPAGGSPTGLPTGPVVYQASLVTI